MTRLSLLTVIGFSAALAVGCSQEPAKTEPAKTEQAPAVQPAPAAAPAAAEKKEHVFRGKVEQVDPKTKTLTVNGENVEGWMSAMTMQYSADKPDVYDKVKPGDQITAKVYDGDFGTLHDVQVVK
jgi:Cu/Ag efflux protein CusF